MQEFLALRRRLLNALKEVEGEECPGKLYEGEMSIRVDFPGIYDTGCDSDEPEHYAIEAHFYLIGPMRHYEWHGKTLKGVVENAANDIDTWLVLAIAVIICAMSTGGGGDE